jgi:hypothetical protein
MARSQSASRGYGYGRSGYVSGLSAVVCASVLYLDVLRALAGVCVIFIHTTADLLYQVSAFHTTAWRLALILNVASRWCVPVMSCSRAPSCWIIVGDIPRGSFIANGL